MQRDPKTHLAVIPKEILDIWELKFGKREKPPHYSVCKLCGISAGQHYGTDCPDERVKKLAKQNEKLLEALKKNYDFTKYAGACKKVNTDEYLEKFFELGEEAQKLADAAIVLTEKES